MHKRPYESILDLIGQTPVLHLRNLRAEGSAEIYAKLEFHNPGGSIKDRPALQMVLDAEAAGLLRPGATIIEPTAGNTGIGLALVGVARGYTVIVVVPEGFSPEKSMLMESLGARVVHTPAAARMTGAIAEARRLAAEIPGAFVPQQFENISNPEVHYRTTGSELWESDGTEDGTFLLADLAPGSADHYLAYATATPSGLYFVIDNRTAGREPWVFRPAPLSTIPGDIRPDGRLDYNDIMTLAAWWLQTNCGTCQGADLAGNDSTVDFNDLARLRQYLTP